MRATCARGWRCCTRQRCTGRAGRCSVRAWGARTMLDKVQKSEQMSPRARAERFSEVANK
ncbi:hypothetical protein F511_38670 [Dorcoceras hygrometricum]|uniref:Uncharacterized protein n=1 Tax=Dorcoceras hygrometricum TaxID=472368 RepID=A0A2Z7BLJ9_9LAMI|nr:hypothetical protein F511_38670 [Dorcoceras hygrometricum]